MPNKSERTILVRTILAYSGAFIGVFNQLWIYPLAFDLYGEIQFILAMAFFVIPFGSFGLLNIISRYYPYFKDEEKDVFPAIILFFASLSFGIFLVLFLLFEPKVYLLLESIGLNSESFKTYSRIILAVAYCLIINKFVSLFAAFKKKIVLPYLFNNFLFKLIIPALILIYYFWALNFVHVLWIFSCIHIIISSLLLIYLFKHLKFSFILRITKTVKAHAKSIFYYTLFQIFLSLGTVLALNIDKIMLRGITTNEITGIYSSLVSIAALIYFPTEALLSLMSPKFSGLFAEKNFKKINALNIEIKHILLIISGILFILISANFQDIVSFASNSEKFMIGITAFTILAFARFIDSVFGFNYVFISFSKYYYVGVLSLILLSGLNIYLNLILIPEYGLTGAACATLVSIASYNLIYYIFNWSILKIQGFTINSLIIFLLFCCIYFGALQIDFKNAFLNIILRSCFIVITGIGTILLFNLSPYLKTKIKALKKKYL